MLAELLEKGRNTLHKFAGLLGESTGISPASLSTKLKAEASVKLDLPSFQQ